MSVDQASADLAFHPSMTVRLATDQEVTDELAAQAARKDALEADHDRALAEFDALAAQARLHR